MAGSSGSKKQRERGSDTGRNFGAHGIHVKKDIRKLPPGQGCKVAE
jgi:hypothetical protein